MIFGVKVYLRRKSRHIIRAHVVDSSGNEVYTSIMEYVSDRILMIIVAANNLVIMTSYTANAYLNTNIQENILTRAGAEFELVGIMAEGTLLEVIKALYGLPTSGNMWQTYHIT